MLIVNVLQYHFVGLDKIPSNEPASNPDYAGNPIQTVTPSRASSGDVCQDTVSSNTSDNSSDKQTSAKSGESDAPIDDETIEQGDEHIMQITGGPQASMMSVENPESFEQILSIAPAEGQRPISIMTNAKFEAMCNPEKFCYGDGGFSAERPRKLTYRKYFNQRLLDVVGRFARDLDYLLILFLSTLLKLSKWQMMAIILYGDRNQIGS